MRQSRFLLTEGLPALTVACMEEMEGRNGRKKLLVHIEDSYVNALQQCDG